MLNNISFLALFVFLTTFFESLQDVSCTGIT